MFEVISSFISKHSVYKIIGTIIFVQKFMFIYNQAVIVTG